MAGLFYFGFVRLLLWGLWGFCLLFLFFVVGEEDGCEADEEDW